MTRQVKVIAEIGNTHEGSLGLAKQFVLACSACGVNAVKFQTHIFSAESLLDAPNPPYFKDESRKEYFERTAFTKRQWKELKRFTEEECKLTFVSSPFSIEALDLLEDVGVNVIKIPSGEVSNIPLLKECAKSGKTILLSTGMSSMSELDRAVETLRSGNIKDLTVLQCTSKYPCPPEDAGLNIISQLKRRYELPVGFSDHTTGIAIPLAAVALGACVIEKHFTLSRLMYGSDAKNSMEPDDFKKLVLGIREVEKALSSELDKNVLVTQMAEMKRTFEKSIVASVEIKKGSKLKEDYFCYKKPGYGIPASQYTQIIGRTVRRNIAMNTRITWDDLE